MQRNLRTFSNGKVDSYDVTLTMQLPHSLDEIWGALVKVEKLQHWFGPVTGGLSKGGTFHLGEIAQGKITACEPKRRLAMIWQQGTAQTGLDITFATVGKGKSKKSKLTLKITAKMQDLPENAWQTFGPAALGIGWEWVMSRFVAYLTDPKAARLNIVDFAKTPEGHVFVTQAFDGWRSSAQTDIMAGPVPSLLVFYNGLPI